MPDDTKKVRAACPSCGCRFYQESGPCLGEEAEEALMGLLEQTRNTSRFRILGLDTSEMTLANMKAVRVLVRIQEALHG